MSLVWIVTTGNSDFKLDRDDGFSHLRREKNLDLKPCQNKFSKLIQGDDHLFSLPARAMGIIYGDAWETHEKYWKFPLLERFAKMLRDRRKIPDRIIVLLTDQEKIFLDDSDDSRYDRYEDSPYWRDTCRLEPVFKNYFDREFGRDKIQFLFLNPSTKEKGLDNWDAALELVQEKFQTISVEEDDSIIVSHQAGTPAISSAVQFASLARFGNRVSFLISNERDSSLTRFISSSEYLRGIRRKEAEALLKSYNYAGVEALIKDYIEEDEDVKSLLSAAKNWNVAKFDDFLKGLVDHPKFISDVAERERKGNWWWIAYEEAYLAVIRRNQDNIVEAFFHSFRSFEGIFAAWGNREFGDHIYEFKGIPHLDQTILNDPKGYFSNLPNKKIKDSIKEIQSKLEAPKELINNDKRVELNFSTLCKLFRAFRYSDYTSNCSDLKIFWDDDKQKNVSSHRNNIVHQVNGMSKKDLWNFWHITAPEESDKVKDRLWEEKLLKFLNFIVKNDVPEGFTTLEEASLMVKVHQELEKAISNL
jgi:hypothetical protein